jgi:uncharacterized protein YkwD
VLDFVHTRWRALLLGTTVALLSAAAIALPRVAAGQESVAGVVAGHEWAAGAPVGDESVVSHESVAGHESVSAAASGCRGAGARAARASRARLHAALLCLINRERAARGVRPLRHDRRLVRAATRHARDMVRRRYFGHQRAGGPGLQARLSRAGWRGRAWGETIAYGCGASGSPRAIVRSWMASPGHATILLSGRFGRGGPAVAKRAPVRCRGGATWVLDVGRR